MSPFGVGAHITPEMRDVPDAGLLEQFAQNESEAAFAALVERHINLVYSIALRHTANPHHAQEITQAVFIILARKARSLHRRIVLSGWLYHTARLTAANFQRAEWRRVRREQEACMQSTLDDHPMDAAWRELSPLLDEAMARLGPTDRDALVLRYFENKSLREVGDALGLQERAAQKRVLRGLEKLRTFFARRGVALTTALIAGAVSANSVQAAPVGLAAAVSAAAAKGAAVSGSTLTLIKGALKIMAWTKAKTVTVAAVGILLAAGTTTVTVEKIHEHQNEAWQLGKLNADFLQKPPYRTVILPTKSAKRSRKNGFGGMVWMTDGRIYGLNAPIEEMLRVANVDYGSVSQSRTLLNTEIPTNTYDFFSNPPKGSKAALRLEIKRKFGVAGRFETIETNVLFLKVRYPDAAGLKPSVSKNGSTSDGNGSIRMARATTDDLAVVMENHFKIPVINQTGLTNSFDIKILWNDQDETTGDGHPIRFHLDELKQALTDQLGLELVPATAPVEMLVIERAKN
jgi:RNA polymerase sigma factor (sigma-70 family)